MKIKIIQKNAETFAASKWSLTWVHYHFQQSLLVLFEGRSSLVLEINLMFHFTFRLPPNFAQTTILNAPGSNAFSQEHWKTTYNYAKFGGQTEWILGNSKLVNMLAFSISWSFELPEPLKNLLMLLPSLFLFIFLSPDYIDFTVIVRIYHVFVRGSTVATRMKTCLRNAIFWRWCS